MSKTAIVVVGGVGALGLVGLVWYLSKPKTPNGGQQSGDDTGTKTVAATGESRALRI